MTDDGSQLLALPGDACLLLVQVAMVVSLACSGGLKGGLCSQSSLVGLLLAAPLCQSNPFPHIQLLVLSMPPVQTLVSHYHTPVTDGVM